MIAMFRKLAAPLLALGMALGGAGPVAAGDAYDNTGTDTGLTVFYSSTGATQLGDRVMLSAPSTVERVETQFFNNGTDASFDAELRFFDPSTPTPSLIAPAFTVSGLSILSGESLTVSFTGLGGLALPQDLIVMFAVTQVSAGGDLGLNLFDPPTVGSSDATFFLSDSGTGIVQAATLLDMDNIHLSISTMAAPVPEASTSLLLVCGLLGLALLSRRRA